MYIGNHIYKTAPIRNGKLGPNFFPSWGLIGRHYAKVLLSCHHIRMVGQVTTFFLLPLTQPYYYFTHTYICIYKSRCHSEIETIQILQGNQFR